MIGAAYHSLERGNACRLQTVLLFLSFFEKNPLSFAVTCHSERAEIRTQELGFARATSKRMKEEFGPRLQACKLLLKTLPTFFWAFHRTFQQTRYPSRFSSLPSPQLLLEASKFNIKHAQFGENVELFSVSCPNPWQRWIITKQCWSEQQRNLKFNCR